MNQGVTFDFPYDLTEQSKSVYRTEITVFYCAFGSKITIYYLDFAERMNLFIVVYRIT